MVEDADVIARARAAAEELLETDPDLESLPALREAMTRWDAAQAEFLEKS